MVKDDELIEVELDNGKKIMVEQLTGSGDSTCCKCGLTAWTCFMYRYKGKIYCWPCLRGLEDV